MSKKHEITVLLNAAIDMLHEHSNLQRQVEFYRGLDQEHDEMREERDTAIRLAEQRAEQILRLEEELKKHDPCAHKIVSSKDPLLLDREAVEDLERLMAAIYKEEWKYWTGTSLAEAVKQAIVVLSIDSSVRGSVCPFSLVANDGKENYCELMHMVQHAISKVQELLPEKDE